MVQREVADRFFAVSENEGLRRRLGPRPARDRAHRASTRSRARSSARGRTSSRRSSRSGASRPASTRPSSDSSRHRSRTGARRSRTRSRSRASPAASGPRPRSRRSVGAPAPAPRSSSRPSSSPSRPRSHDQRRGPGEDQPRPRGRRRRGPTGCTRSRRSSSGSTSATRSRSSRPPSSRSRASPTTRSSGARSKRSQPRRGVEPRWRARIEKRIPGGGRARWGKLATRRPRSSSRASCSPLPPRRDPTRARSQRGLGVDVPFFLEPGPQLGTGDGNDARAARPAAGLHGPARDAARRQQARRPPRSTLASTATRASTSAREHSCSRSRTPGRAADLAALPPNDLARSPLAAELRSPRGVPGRRQRGRARSSTACSEIGPPRRSQPRGLGARRRPGSRPLRGSVFPAMATDAADVLDKPESRPGRYLREHTTAAGALDRRDRGDCWRSSGLIPHLAISTSSRSVAIAWYVVVGRKYTSATARHISWIFAASQAIAVLIPASLPDVQVDRDRRDRRRSRSSALVLLFAERDKL